MNETNDALPSRVDAALRFLSIGISPGATGNFAHTSAMKVMSDYLQPCPPPQPEKGCDKTCEPSVQEDACPAVNNQQMYLSLEEVKIIKAHRLLRVIRVL